MLLDCGARNQEPGIPGIRKRFRFVLLFCKTKETRNGKSRFLIPESHVCMGLQPETGRSRKRYSTNATAFESSTGFCC